MRIVMKDRQPFIFAGLWDLWRGDPEAGELYTFTIIITHPCQFIVAPHSSQNARDHRQTGRSDLARSGLLAPVCSQSSCSRSHY